MKHHPRQNITLKIYSVSDDTASRLMTALGKLLHSPRFTRKAERWKLFRSTPPLSIGHQMTYAERTRFQAAYRRTLSDPAFAGMLDDAGILWRFRTLGFYKYPVAGRTDSSKPNEANKPKSFDEKFQQHIRAATGHAAVALHRAFAGQNTRGLL